MIQGYIRGFVLTVMMRVTYKLRTEVEKKFSLEKEK